MGDRVGHVGESPEASRLHTLTPVDVAAEGELINQELDTSCHQSLVGQVGAPSGRECATWSSRAASSGGAVLQRSPWMWRRAQGHSHARTARSVACQTSRGGGSPPPAAPVGGGSGSVAVGAAPGGAGAPATRLAPPAPAAPSVAPALLAETAATSADSAGRAPGALSPAAPGGLDCGT